MKPKKARASRGKRKKQNKRPRLATAFIAAIVIAALGFFAFSAYGAARCEGILPNVRAYGVELGGLNRTEAQAAIEAGTGVPSSGVVLSMPDGSALEFPRADTIADYDPAAAAQAAWNYGRADGRVSPLRYALALSRATELYPDSLRADGEALRTAVSRRAAQVNSAAMEGSYSVNGSSLTIIKGAKGVLIDEDEVYSIVLAAFESGSGSAEYAPKETAPAPLSIDDIHSALCREPRSARFDADFAVIAGEDGISFDIEHARALYDAAEDGSVISVTLQLTRPEVTTEELSALLYRDKLAEWTSELTPNEVRSKNVQLAAEAVNGIILLPGDEFSFNSVVGERTTERGFGAAAAYSNGETVNEVGGGICQVSSSIYYCCLVSDMKIVSRTCHLYPAAYVPLGMDATVSWGGPEFKFVNSSEFPLKILTWRDGNQLFCEFYGTKTTDEYIKPSYELLDTQPFETIYMEDESIEAGHTKVKTSGRDGLSVATSKLRYAADGTLISREAVDRSYYSRRDKLILVAPGELWLYDPSAAPPEPSPEPSEEPEPSPEPSAEPEDEMIWDDM